MALRVFLGLSALIWLPYGLFCFLHPDSLADAAGVTATSTTATIELRAMYGGLQVAIGALAILALARAAFVRPALMTLAFLCAGLGTARLAGAVMASEFSDYTAFGLVFELGSASGAAWLLSRATEGRA